MSGTQDQATGAAEGHFLRFEPPDLIIGRPVGSLTIEDARATWDFVLRESRHRYASGAMRSAPEAVMKKFRAVALVGGNFRQRTLISIATRAARLLGKSTSIPRIEFFDDETSARAWIDEKRAKRGA